MLVWLLEIVVVFVELKLFWKVSDEKLVDPPTDIEVGASFEFVPAPAKVRLLNALVDPGLTPDVLVVTSYQLVPVNAVDEPLGFH